VGLNAAQPYVLKFEKAVDEGGKEDIKAVCTVLRKENARDRGLESGVIAR